MAIEIIIFYILFEATLIPTLIIIIRWGNQTEWVKVDLYFLFYALISSLSRLVILTYLQNFLVSLNFLLFNYNNILKLTTWSSNIMWLACLIAFIVKIPLHGLHLWLPKAQVEAPIVGSIVLAVILLNFEGYVIIWILQLLNLKLVIAYSSVSHIALLMVAILIQTPLSFMGATPLIIAMASHYPYYFVSQILILNAFTAEPDP